MKEAEGQGRAAETLSLGLGRRLSRQRQQERLWGSWGEGTKHCKREMWEEGTGKGQDWGDPSMGAGDTGDTQRSSEVGSPAAEQRNIVTREHGPRCSWPGLMTPHLSRPASLGLGGISWVWGHAR